MADDIRGLVESVQDYIGGGGLDEDARYVLGPHAYEGLSKFASLANFIGPGADIKDIASESAKVMEGNTAALAGLPAALAMMVVPGSKSGVEEVVEKTSEAISPVRRVVEDNVEVPDQLPDRISIFPKPQRMFDEADRPRGGEYLNPKTNEALTGKNISSANISVKEGRPEFTGIADDVAKVGSSGKGTFKTKTNLFKKSAGWKWVDGPEEYADLPTLVSVQQKGKHYYTVDADFPAGVNLTRYADSPSEPRLRPTLQAQPVELGDVIGKISVRGKEHPVYNRIVAKAAGGLVQRNPYNYEPKAI